MAAAGTLGAASTLWPPATAILPASSSSSSKTSRTSASTNAPRLSLTGGLNWSARGPVASDSLSPTPSCQLPPPSPGLSQPSPALVRPWPLPPPVAAATAPSCPCPAVPSPSGVAVAGLSGDGGDDTLTDDGECVGKAGSGVGGAPANGPPRPAPPPTLAPRILAPPTGAAWRLLLATNWTSALTCPTLLRSTWHCVPGLAAIPFTPLLLRSGLRALLAQPVCGHGAAVSTGVFTRAFRIRRTVPLACPIPPPSAALISPHGRVLDGLVLPLAFLPRSTFQSCDLRPRG